MYYNPIAVGNRIKKARENKHWTQETLAAMVETSVKTIYNLERGDTDPHTSILADVIYVLGMDSNYALWGHCAESTPRNTLSEIVKLINDTNPDIIEGLGR